MRFSFKGNSSHVAFLACWLRSNLLVSSCRLGCLDPKSKISEVDRPVNVRPSHRRAMPDLDHLLLQANQLLKRASLPLCTRLTPHGCEQDTANPTVIGESRDKKYVIKCCFRYPATLGRQLTLANAIRNTTGLPIPQHYTCATDSDPIPLMIMEWMQGESLGAKFTSSGREDARYMALDYGRVQAHFHTAIIPNLELLLPQAHPKQDWHRDAVLDVVQHPPKHVPKDVWLRLSPFLESRLNGLKRPLSPGLVKIDDDFRDYLVEAKPRPHISAMLDWEHVWQGDTAHAVSMVFHRFWLSDLTELWPSFRVGYERAAGRPIAYGGQVEAYLAWRLLRATVPGGKASEPARSRAWKLLTLLMEGNVLSEYMAG
jgi:hypothetical protein